MPNIIATHPLVSHKLTRLRNEKTITSDFRHCLKEITFYLGYEATRTLELDKTDVNTPLNVPFSGSSVHDKVAIIPILRAGLGMSDAIQDLMPKAIVHHIGMYCSKSNPLPVLYFNRLPKECNCDVAYILDACIATAQTISAVCSMIKKWGAKKVVVIAIIASKEGLKRLNELHPDVDVHIAAVDDDLIEGKIVPGLGDAGDRIFNTPDLGSAAAATENTIVSKRKISEV